MKLPPKVTSMIVSSVLGPVLIEVGKRLASITAKVGKNKGRLDCLERRCGELEERVEKLEP